MAAVMVELLRHHDNGVEMQMIALEDGPHLVAGNVIELSEEGGPKEEWQAYSVYRCEDSDSEHRHDKCFAGESGT